MSKLKDAIYGFAIGDALGVPYEFKERGTFNCQTMIGHGTWNQKAGTFSDDTSLTLATCASIKKYGVIKYQDIMKRFTRWYIDGEYAIDRVVFDIGNTTMSAIHKFDGINPFCGDTDAWSNGNGSLMRVLPLAFVNNITDDEIANVSRLTHAHELSIDICIKYVRLAQDIINGNVVELSYEEPIKSTGFVKDTFNSVIYAFSTTSSYKECVLKAVNLGGDTDTITAIAGGLAGIKYGYDSIPSEWIKTLRGKDIIDSCLF